MEEEISEKEAQLQYENSKLQDELNHLKDHTLSVEENLNAVHCKLSQKENIIKSLEQQVNLLCQAMKEKEQLVELLEHEKGCINLWKDKLFSENLSLKEALKKERLISDQIHMLKTSEEELRNLNAKLKKENSQLVFEIHVKSEELSLSTASLKSLQLQIKELEDEKAELVAMKDMLLSREKEEHLKSLETKMCFLKKSLEWPKFSSTFCAHYDQESTLISCNKGGVDINLREEILEVEVHEKQNRITQLEKLLLEKETLEAERNNLISKLKRKLNNLEVLKCDWNTNFKIDSTTIYDIYEDLIKILNWPEGQPNECKPLTEMASLAVVVKNGVQTTQPGPIRIVETISIASQTDPIKNLSPVLFPRTIEMLKSDQNNLHSDDQEEEALQFLEDNKSRNVVQLFSEHKNCDLDMDIYRSCRKLSVLPEEDNDESFIRKSSLKNSDFKLKTHSADDISQFKTVKLIFKESSCSNLIPLENSRKSAKQLKECVLKISEASFKNPDSSFKNATDNFIKTDSNKNGNELLLLSLSPKDVFRQPHSFDSYLNPSQKQTGNLTRQVSDPTQNSVFTPIITRRGSYIRRPRSTCRPLTLTCDKEERKKEERICKVRFDLPHKDKTSNEKGADSAAVLNNNEPIKIISRFRVEVIDEVEFRKSIEQQPTNGVVSRKRPPLIHSVVYKQSVLRDITNLNSENEKLPNDNANLKAVLSESPDSPTYDTATEGSPAESIDIDNSLILIDPLPLKKRKQSDSSCYSIEDNQDSSEGNDIFINSVKLHSSSECIVMKALSRESSGSSTSNTDQDIPCIDTEDLPVIKPSPEILKTTILPEILFSEKKPPVVLSPGCVSEDSDIFYTPCDVTPVSENESSIISVPKSSSLSKSPTVLKNLSNFEILSVITESRKMVSGQISEEDETEERDDKRHEESKEMPGTERADKLKRTSSDMSETSESDTLTYGTVKSQLQLSSDNDSDTYVTVWSEKSAGLERKFSDLSENSSSPYNTPPDTSTASFCTPPDTYSPVLGLMKKFSVDKSGKTSDNYSIENKQFSDDAYNFNSSVRCKPHSSNLSDQNIEKLSEGEFKTDLKSDNTFDSPKLEFYETVDSVENLKSFLQSEEGLTEYGFKEVEELRNSTDSPETRIFGLEDEVRNIKQNSLENSRLLDRRGKKHPLLSRQNSTEEFNFLDNHDSCLNLSEEISSPSTTPDTSNKTVIMKSFPLTVSNTIDLEDEDFPISEAEMKLNITESQTNVLEILLKRETPRKIQEVHYHSEPCTPSISSPLDFPEFAILRKQRSSCNDESLICGKFDANLPEIIISNLSSESDNSDSEILDLAATDFASNVSERSEVNLSDVKSISGLSENCGSSSEHSDNIVSDVFSSDSDKSSVISPEVSQNSSYPLAMDGTPPDETSMQEVDGNLKSQNGCDALFNDQIQTVFAFSSSDSQDIPSERQRENMDVYSEDATNFTNEASVSMWQVLHLAIVALPS